MPDVCILYDWIHLSLKCLDTRLGVCVYLDSVCVVIVIISSGAVCTDCVAGKYSRYVTSTSTCTASITTHMSILYLLLFSIDVVSVRFDYNCNSYIDLVDVVVVLQQQCKCLCILMLNTLVCE